MLIAPRSATIRYFCGAGVYGCCQRPSKVKVDSIACTPGILRGRDAATIGCNAGVESCIDKFGDRFLGLGEQVLIVATLNLLPHQFDVVKARVAAAIKNPDDLF